MPKYPNQEVITINTPTMKKGGGTFMQISHQDITRAANDLTASQFKVWLYFCGHANQYELEISSAKLCQMMKMSKNTYHTAKQVLISKGYIIPVYRGRYEFFRTPKIDTVIDI